MIMAHDVFISYSSQQNKAAEAICHLLEQNDIRCWMAPRNIPGGAQYGDVIDEAIKTSKIVIVLFSKSASKSPWVAGELNVAFEEQKVIIPFRLDNTPLKGQNRVMLNQKHWIDAYPDYQTKFQDLVDAIKQSLGMQVNEGVIIPQNRVLSKRNWIIIFLSIVFGVLSAFLIPYLIRTITPFRYEKNGLNISVKNLSGAQKSSISSILDEMVHVEGGEFIMGNNPLYSDFITDQDSLSSISHKVSLSNFYISKYEVTQEQWQVFFALDDCCSVFDPYKPVDRISWDDAKRFADLLSSLTGLPFSLPTEAQWEYSARGGKQSRNYMYAGSNECDDVAWTCDNNLTSPQEVGNGRSKRANELNICDMTGNVSEWCLDYYAPYNPEADKDPVGPNTGTYRICRGGDYTVGNVFDCKTTTRFYFAPFNKRAATGIRLVINKQD